MIRTLVDKLRLLIVGPNLMRLARMPREDMNQLLELGADDFILNGGVQPPSDSPSPQATIDSEEVSRLKQHIARLEERITVLEHINYENVPLKHNTETCLDSSQRQQHLS